MTVKFILGHVAEGILCATAVTDLAKSFNVGMPITINMGNVFSGQITANEPIQILMDRDQN
jgi:glycerol-3-phosphate dehydrogenase (NAD(P)+)